MKKTGCSKENIREAVSEVLRGNMSIREACEKYMVGSQNLRNRLYVASGKKIMKKQDRKRVLAPSQEEELVTTVPEMNQLRIGDRLYLWSGKKIMKKQDRKRVLAPSQEEELVTTVTEMNQLRIGDQQSVGCFDSR